MVTKTIECMKSIVYIIISIFAVSCDKSVMSNNIPNSDALISFTSEKSAVDWGTRGISVDDINSLSQIMVYAFLSDVDGVESCYIDHREATQREGLWSFTPAYYYPLHESLDFLAYSPKADVVSNGIAQTLDFDNKAITISYNVPLVGRNHPDLMLAAAVKECDRENPLQALHFNHALTQLSMSAKVGSLTESDRYVITRFTLHNIATGAEMSYSIDNGIGEWQETSSGDFITSSMLPDPLLGESQVKLTDQYQSIMGNGHTLFMIPQAIEQREVAPTIQVVIYDTEQDAELTYRTDRLVLPSPNGNGWQAGQHINLQFAFDVNDEELVVPMTLTAKLLDWVEQEIDEEIDKNIYSFLDKSSVESGATTLTLYTNGVVSDIRADGQIITSALLGKADSNGYYQIAITTGGMGVGQITIVIENSHDTTITKTFNITVA